MTKGDEDRRRDDATAENRPRVEESNKGVQPPGENKPTRTGGADRSLQSEARGMDADRDAANNSATSGGNAGRITDLSDTPDPEEKGD